MGGSAGWQRLYTLRPEPLRQLADWLGPYERFWRARLADLRDVLDELPDGERTAIAVDQFLAHPPAEVWRALTNSDLIARWLMPNDFRPVRGHRFPFRTEQRRTFTLLDGGWRSHVWRRLEAVLATAD